MDKEKMKFTIALVFIITFLLITAGVIAYSVLTKTQIWPEYQPYFTGMIGIVGIIIGHYFSNITQSISSAMKK